METASPQLPGRPKQVTIRDPTWINIFLLYILYLASVDARASYKSRTIETGNSFLEGLGFEQSTYVDNEKSRYYKDEFGCARYDQEVGACKLLVQGHI